MAETEFVSGPRQIGHPHSEIVDSFTDLWLRVSRGGGAVDFTPSVDPEAVRAAAVRAVAEVAERRAAMLVLERGPRLIGVVFLAGGTRDVTRHRSVVRQLMVDPAEQGRGHGARLLRACEELARERGVEQLHLAARDGTGLPEYYTRRGWREVGRLPGAVRVAPGDDRDEVWFFRRV